MAKNPRLADVVERIESEKERLKMRNNMKITNRKFIILFLVLIAFALPAAAQKQKIQATALPVKYDEHRFFVEPETESGQKVLFYTDSGGGLFIFKDAAEKIVPVKAAKEGFEPIEFPAFKTGFAVPAPLGNGGKVYVMERQPNMPKIGESVGMLGQAWFAGRIWTFDYPSQKLLLWTEAPDIFKKKSSKIVNLGFKTDEKGARALNFPRIQVEIDGEVLELLFDTGATTFLTKEAMDALKDGGKDERATSFITNATFEKWRKAHPDWRVIEAAEKGTNQAMIEVPKVKIAGYEVGPVWFTRRADKNFHEYMSQFMDRKVEGAIGGNALWHFRITVDYPRAVAVFEKK
jgi:hypothetical protein